ncbi:hypothetical protein [Moorella sp. Hama-1]|uniref:hypothetical protein n=1 Tax=Moorella sp. Hama-1 TaxID=2138101 RepID=UPI000D656D88|nr:hypothetical protein [Moorella sp. Hama-1]MDN5361009.1 hypothetical protein [Moorella sp. (in: firmicutes)]BCV22330.1 hypothetical protein hamaS1_23990 [Moorella sp. Hama-1]
MSTRYVRGREHDDRLSPYWSFFYISAALVITFLYYRNLGLWRLLENAHKWWEWARAALG